MKSVLDNQLTGRGGISEDVSAPTGARDTLSAPRLVHYSPAQQHEGAFLRGFDWTHWCTATFRVKPQEHEAVMFLRGWARSLSDALHWKKADMAYYAVLEDRYSGLGNRCCRRHWHFVMSCPDNPYVATVAEQLWGRNGISEFEQYEPMRNGCFYLVKLIAEGARNEVFNMDKLKSGAPSDLRASTSDYVPERLVMKTHGSYLTLRSKPRSL
jgi:hypothetical protein